MSAFSHHRWRCVIAAIAVALPGSLALAQGTMDGTHPLRLTDQAPSFVWNSQEEERTDVTTVETITADPYSFDLSLGVYSDYIFRGMNRSEYAGEGREKFNYQMDLAVNVDIGLLVGQDADTCGTFTFGTWWEWYAQQKKLDPVDGGQNWQELRYNLTWSYDLESIASTFSLGYIFYTFPNNKAGNTQEWWFGLDHNDAWLWKKWWPDNEEGVFNPTFKFYQDTRTAGANTVWMEIGLSHEFQVCSHTTMTPSWTLGIDHDYYAEFAGETNKNTTRFGNMLWGLDMTYDLTERLALPESWGSMSLTGSIYFSDALGNSEDGGAIQDEFFGGLSFGWSF